MVKLASREFGDGLQLDIGDQDCPADFVVEFQGRLADDLNLQKPGCSGNGKIMICFRPGDAAVKLSENLVNAPRLLRIVNSESDSLIRGEILSPDKGAKVIAARLDNG